jgi:O-antigen/teichoic acid export membrane protein
MTRLYGPESYGVLAIYMSITGVIGVFISSGYTQAIMLPSDNNYAKQIVWLSILLNTIISVTTLIAILFFQFFSVNKIELWYYVIPFSIFFGGITAILTLWANRVKDYKNLTTNRIVQAIITVIIQILFGIYYSNFLGLLMGLFFGQIYSAISLTYNFYLRGNRKNHIGKPVRSTFNLILKEYKQLVIYTTPGELINNFINQTPIILLYRFGGVMGATLVGNFSFTQRILGMPQQLISSSIIDVFKQKASEEYNKTNSCKILYLKTMKLLLLISIGPLIITYLFAPDIFKFVFGEKWFLAGLFSKYLCVLFFLRFTVSPLTYTFILARKFKEDFILHIFFLIAIILGFTLGDYFFEDKKILVLIYSFIYSIVYLVYFYKSYKYSDSSE